MSSRFWPAGAERADGVPLVCLPPAGGGSASFRPWRGKVPAPLRLCVVELPGRGSRRAEPVPAYLAALAEDVAEAVGKLGTEREYVLFGHSFGALLGYEVAVALRRAGDPPPRQLVVSASPAPAVARRQLHGALDGTDAMAVLDHWGGTPPELCGRADLRRLAGATIRADCRMLATYRPSDEVLDIPITVLGGRDDPMTDTAGLRAWDSVSTAGAEVVEFPGGHFFLHEQTAPVLAEIARRVLA